jgi:hypothetical protein
MIVEPFANDQLKDNLNPVGRVCYSFSTLLCTPCSRSQEVGLCLGAQAGETRIRNVVTRPGSIRFRRATETPFNIVTKLGHSLLVKGACGRTSDRQMRLGWTSAPEPTYSVSGVVLQQQDSLTSKVRKATIADLP